MSDKRSLLVVFDGDGRFVTAPLASSQTSKGQGNRQVSPPPAQGNPRQLATTQNRRAGGVAIAESGVAVVFESGKPFVL